MSLLNQGIVTSRREPAKAPRARGLTALIAAAPLLTVSISPYVEPAMAQEKQTEANPGTNGAPQNLDATPTGELNETFVLLNDQDLAAFRRSDYKRESLLARCDQVADIAPDPVEIFDAKPHYSSTGVVDNQKKISFKEDARRSYDFGLCYLATGDSKWAKKVHQIADAWGNTLVATSSQQAINEINFNAVYLLAAAQWTKNVDSWDHQSFDAMAAKVFLDSAAHNASRTNNHGAWGYFLMSALGAYLENGEILNRASEGWEAHNLKAIDAEGKLTEEITRSDTNNWNGGPTKGIKGMAYTHYALYPTVMAGKILSDNGRNVWNTPAGEKVGKAGEQAALWIQNPASFPYFSSNCGQLYDVNNFAYFPVLFNQFGSKQVKKVIDNYPAGGDLFKADILFQHTAPKLTPATTPFANPPAFKDNQCRADQAQHLDGFLLNASELEAFQADAQTRDQLLDICAANEDFEPHVQTSLDLADHYDEKGVRKENSKNEFNGDARMAYRFGLCYLQSGDQKWAKKVHKIADTWGENLTTLSTKQAKLELNFNAQYLLAAAYWTKNVNSWDHATFDSFVVNTIKPVAQLDNENNHGLWATYLYAAIGTYLDDADILDQTREQWQEHVDSVIAEDGVLTREITRTDTNNYNDGPRKGIKGLAYTHYSLLPTVLAAKMLADSGRPVWDTPAGHRLDKATRQVSRWISEPDKFPYYESNCGQLYEVTNFSYLPLAFNAYRAPEVEKVIKEKTMTLDLFLLAPMFRTSAPEMTVSDSPYPRPASAEESTCTHHGASESDTAGQMPGTELGTGTESNGQEAPGGSPTKGSLEGSSSVASSGRGHFIGVLVALLGLAGLLHTMSTFLQGQQLILGSPTDILLGFLRR